MKAESASAKFTPGPWTHHRTHMASHDQWFVIVDANGRGPIMEVGGSDFAGQVAEAKHLITDPAVIEANARLIAASPNLYSYVAKKAEDGDAEAQSIIAAI